MSKQQGALARRATAALAFGASMLASMPAAAAGCELQQVEIPVRIVDRRPIATLTINGVDLPVLLDSGAFFSMLSAATAAELKLPLRDMPHGMGVQGYTGRVDTRLATVESMRLLGTEIRNVEFLVGGQDLNAGIMGLMGRNILSMGDIDFDLAHGMVRLVFPQGDCKKTNFAHWAGDAPVVVASFISGQRREATAMRVEVLLNGRSTVALLDTGAPQTMVSWAAARRAGVERKNLTPFGIATGVGDGQATSWLGTIDSFELEGEKITNNRLRIDDTSGTVDGEGMVLGLDYFLSHRIYVSRLQRQVYVTWNGGTVFAHNTAASADRGESPFAARAQEIAPDDADALARRGEAAIAARNYQRALEDLNRACELAPGVAANFYARARTYLALRQTHAALLDLDEALRLDAGLSEARLRRAVLRTGADDRVGALADLQHLDATLPSTSALRRTMVEMYAGFGLASDAVRQFELWAASRRTESNVSSVLNERCWLRTRLNVDLPLAIQDCQEAVAQDGKQARYRDSLGWAHLRMGDAGAAKKAFDGAVRLESLAFSLYGRALAQQRLNDPAAAERDLAAARALDPRIDEAVRKQGFEVAAGQPPPASPMPPAEPDDS